MWYDIHIYVFRRQRVNIKNLLYVTKNENEDFLLRQRAYHLPLKQESLQGIG